jgi:hypothetical protein
MRSYFAVYLSGPVSGLPYQAAHQWREFVSRAFPSHIQGVSPMRGRRYLDDGPAVHCAADCFPLSTDRATTMRSHFDTVRADAVLVNLLGATDVSIETMMEIAWAYDRKIPVVVAIEPNGNVHDHPMLRDCLTVRVTSLEEAIEAVVAIVSPSESLIWNRIEQISMLREEHRLDLNQEPHKEVMSVGYAPH